MLKGEIENEILSIFFAAADPVKPAELLGVYPDADLPQLEALCEAVRQQFNGLQAAMTIQQVAGGYRLTTRPENHEAIRRYLKTKPSAKLSQAALETLAVIAYKQPITMPEILEIRGVKGSSTIKTLLEKKLVEIRGRKKVVGRPMLYGTTQEFLIHFGLNDLGELPSLEEFEEIFGLDNPEGEAEASFEEPLEADIEPDEGDD